MCFFKNIIAFSVGSSFSRLLISAGAAEKKRPLDTLKSLLVYSIFDKKQTPIGFYE